MVPLLELMANKAMKTRHWKRMEEVTGTPFDIESDNFTLRNLLEAPLLQYKEEIEVRRGPFFFLLFPPQGLTAALLHIEDARGGCWSELSE